MLNKMTQQNASKVALFLEENQNSFIAKPKSYFSHYHSKDMEIFGAFH